MEARVEALRRAIPSLTNRVYLNTGTAGPVPLAVQRAMEQQMARDLAAGRAGLEAVHESQACTTAAREAVAGLLGADAGEVVLTHCTTEGVNIVAWSFPWRPGDEVVTTSLEHPGGIAPFSSAAKRFDLRLRVVDLDDGAGDVVDRVAAAITPRTRLVVLSHVAFTTGAILPVGEVARVAHERGCLVLVDGAQSVGAFPVDVRQLDVDFYTVSGQKWLCGPVDTGALYIKRAHLGRLVPAYVGYAGLASWDQRGSYAHHEDARRFEVGARNLPALAGQTASIEWTRNEVGLQWAADRSAALQERFRAALATVPGLTIVSPPGALNLLSFTLDGVDAAAIVERLAEAGIVVRWVHEPYAVRLSLAWFVTDEDIDRVVSTLGTIARSAD
ncbi:MAG TPA: aminotransferase class V-fold PLP-dependent enzyme [Chloroflexota bacterium]